MAKASGGSPVISDGAFSWSGGVNSVSVSTAASPLVPDGLPRNALAWLNNGDLRDGGITQRTGWQPVVRVRDGNALYQGGFMYQPDSGFNYLVLLIGGLLYKVDLVLGAVTQLTTPGLEMPANEPLGFFEQAENYLIVQSGDLVTLPLFWNDTVLRRSIGITTSAPIQQPGQNEIPAAGPMRYYMERLWYAQNNTYSAGDIVGGLAGTVATAKRDAVLNVTESPLAFGGDGFKLRAKSGTIRALREEVNLDAQLGQGRLLIGTQKLIEALTVPVTRANWIASDQNNKPLQVDALRGNGPVNDRSLVSVGSDLFYQSLEPSIRSYVTARRDFTGWGNTIISANEQRAIAFNDRALLKFSSGIYFNNRLLQTALPKQLPQGVIHQALLPLDFQSISSFGVGLQPIWEGMYQGLQILQLFVGDFGGRERAFAVVVSQQDSSFEVWELTPDQRFENGDQRVTWQIEWPAFNWSEPALLKELQAMELWVDKLFGEVIFKMQYRVDSDPCPYDWFEWKQCVSRSTCEDVNNPVCYPEIGHREGFKSGMVLPKPPNTCEASNQRPSNVGMQFQPVLTIRGWCRVRGVLLHATVVERGLYDRIIC